MRLSCYQFLLLSNFLHLKSANIKTASSIFSFINLLLNFVFKLYHKTCEQFYRNFGLYEKSPNSFLPGLPLSIVNQFDFHNFLCLCLASVHLPYPFHLVSAFSFSVTPFRFASSGTISSMRFRAASSILAQYCLTYTQLCRDAFCLRFRRSAMLRVVLAFDAAVKPLASQIINNENHRRDDP